MAQPTAQDELRNAKLGNQPVWRLTIFEKNIVKMLFSKKEHLNILFTNYKNERFYKI